MRSCLLLSLTCMLDSRSQHVLWPLDQAHIGSPSVHAISPEMIAWMYSCKKKGMNNHAPWWSRCICFISLSRPSSVRKCNRWKLFIQLFLNSRAAISERPSLISASSIRRLWFSTAAIRFAAKFAWGGWSPPWFATIGAGSTIGFAFMIDVCLVLKIGNISHI